MLTLNKKQNSNLAKTLFMTQEEIVSKILRKDSSSFTYLYDHYSKSLYGVIFNLIKNKEEAEDVLQEVFVKIWNNIDSYNESKGRLYTWMLNIARNTTIDKLRSKNYKKSAQNLSTDNFVNLLDDNSKETSKIDAIGIKALLRRLKPKCIELFELLFFQGYTQQEASEELNIPLGTVKTNNRNCMNDLRTFVNE